MNEEQAQSTVCFGAVRAPVLTYFKDNAIGLGQYAGVRQSELQPPPDVPYRFVSVLSWGRATGP